MLENNPTAEENSEDSKEKKSFSGPNPESKKTFFFVGLIGVAALFLGFFQIYRHIHSPFQTVLTLNSATQLTSDQLQEIENLKARDTDGDGLSDYEELYIYGTSPYLKDTDSDGISDYDEIFVYGTDPNCPEGMDCTGTQTTTNTNLSPLGQDTPGLTEEKPTAQALREIFKQSGVPQYILDNTSDEELLTIYEQTVSENASLPASDPDPTEGLSEEELANILRTLTPAEIRQLLVEYGLSEENLNQVDDSTLQAIFLQAIEE